MRFSFVANAGSIVCVYAVCCAARDALQAQRAQTGCTAPSCLQRLCRERVLRKDVSINMEKNTRLRALCEGAIMVALAQVLSYLKLFELPQGGSVTVGMFPIFFYCMRWGFGRGMLVSSAYALLQLFLDGAYAWGWESILGDYLIAFAVLGVAGLFCRCPRAYFLGATAGCLARFLVHFVVGATVWSAYMPEQFFGMTMTSPWFYSLLYNGSYMLLDWLLVLLIGALLQKPMKQWFVAQ